MLRAVSAPCFVLVWVRTSHASHRGAVAAQSGSEPALNPAFKLLPQSMRPALPSLPLPDARPRWAKTVEHSQMFSRMYLLIESRGTGPGGGKGNLGSALPIPDSSGAAGGSPEKPYVRKGIGSRLALPAVKRARLAKRSAPCQLHARPRPQN
ncbi:hypothetical protein PaG_05061 [Moesziomyces aphidis]|uniref:Secreted protein n=1 Tax=Moesziomyces aphidis TaxID=84754 RepID=W3VHH3_MOEAP|nr:hypothetical protein PaG_05061 [Moesziomyces aphidis]